MHGPRGRGSEKRRRPSLQSIAAATVLLATRHDPEVLQGASSSLASGCLPGNCRTVTHGGWLGGQFHQALAEPTQAQFLWKPR